MIESFLSIAYIGDVLIVWLQMGARMAKIILILFIRNIFQNLN